MATALELPTLADLVLPQESDRVRNAICLLKSSTKDQSETWTCTGFYTDVKLRILGAILDVRCIMTNYHAFLKKKEWADDMVAVFHQERTDKLVPFELPLVPFEFLAYSEELNYILIEIDESKMQAIDVKPILVDSSQLPVVKQDDIVYMIQHLGGTMKHFKQDTVSRVYKPFIEYYDDTLELEGPPDGSPVFVLKESKFLLVALYISDPRKSVLVSEILDNLDIMSVLRKGKDISRSHSMLSIESGVGSSMSSSESGVGSSMSLSESGVGSSMSSSESGVGSSMSSDEFKKVGSIITKIPALRGTKLRDIYAMRGKFSRILSHLNHSFTCYAYVLYRRLRSMDMIDISVVLLSEFVDDKKEEDIEQLQDHFNEGYLKGEKGMLKRVHTDRSLEMSLDFPGVEKTPFAFKVDQVQLDSVGFVIEFKGIPVKSPANGIVKICEVHRSAECKILWTLRICEMEEETRPESLAEPDAEPEVVYRDTKLTNSEITRMSRMVGVEWASLAGLFNIPYSQQEEIRANSKKYPNSYSKAEQIFVLFNDSRDFSRHVLEKHFEELGRAYLKNEMHPVQNEDAEDEGEDVETLVSLLEISQVQLRDNTPLSPREMYRLSRRIVVDWDRLAGLMDITRAERHDIRCSLLYNDDRSRAEKILSIINNN